jgi:hypothetical protein
MWVLGNFATRLAVKHRLAANPLFTEHLGRPHIKPIETDANEMAKETTGARSLDVSRCPTASIGC